MPDIKLNTRTVEPVRTITRPRISATADGSLDEDRSISAPFHPSALGPPDLAQRLAVVSDSALPSGWLAGHLPQPALPIDECVRDLLKLKKRWIRLPADLQAMHPLGVCPYAVARYGIVCAASFAHKEKQKQEQKRPAIESLKLLEEDLPRFRIHLDYISALIRPLLDVSGQLELSALPLKTLSDHISSVRSDLPEAKAEIQSARRELPKYKGDVWRHGFVTALFREWWVLTGKDPKKSAGPFQDFVCRAWCSLSSRATTMDADWESAIKVALSRHEPAAWRTGPRD